ncbi:nucleotidyltransferase domain-containing protein [Corticicoccus populi]|uniref:Nucleotidyltransferase domain-containing protein n=1 Tax=Corticicoccus populi TaxID=1812821 RepID=A0ABW5WW00_9STAP
MSKLSFIKHEVHLNLVQSVLAEFSNNGKILGIMVVGSVARGEAYPDSDLDLYILIEDGIDKNFQAEIRENILVEYKYFSFKEAQRNMEKNPMEIYSFLDGVILIDRGGQLAQLKMNARPKLDSYCVSKKEVQGIIHWLYSSLNKIKAAEKMEDEFKVSYIISTSTWTMLEGIWAVNNQPMPPSGAVWTYIKKLDTLKEEMDELLSDLFTEELQKRTRAFIKISHWIIIELRKR